MENKEKGKNLNEDNKKKNPYQEFMDMPDDMIIDAREGIELLRKAVLWELENDESK